MYGERLRYIRENRQLSQQELADRCGMHKQQIYRLESDLAEPTGETIKKLAKELEVSADYLLGLVDEPNDHLTTEPLKPAERSLVSAYRRGDWREGMRIFSEHE